MKHLQIPKDIGFVLRPTPCYTTHVLPSTRPKKRRIEYLMHKRLNLEAPQLTIDPLTKVGMKLGT